ncbi:transglutaminase-like domain-containing protein [Alcanivorax sp.]|uniref:transglutaminase-like domain-containing protein n=1 Tax=Alcanivorax sp. TaxID=1872427 RepID=UPI0025C069FC|nr:transglutaminase-like domain-containing protein [Alcanivorax sp.]
MRTDQDYGKRLLRETVKREPLEEAPAIEVLRESRRFFRTVAISILALFLNAVIWPSWALAIETERQKEQHRQAQWEAKNQHLHQVLKHVRDKTNDRKAVIDRRLADEGGTLDNVLTAIGLSQLTLEETSDLAWLAKRADKLHQKALKAFQKTEQRLKNKNLPARVRQRNEHAKAEYQSRYEAMQARLSALLDAESLSEQQEAAASLKQWMDGFTLSKPRDPFDPNNLPWSTPDPSQTPKPAESADELSARSGFPLFEQGVQLASNVITPDMLGNPGGPTEDDLAATLDAPLSEAISAKAEELDDDPVKIYQWVRNNIEFIPSYGSIQGAEYTLQHGKGNAFDTASLLISLLRAANIPARYAFGTVQMPADKVMNWVGNVNTPEAAGNLLGQGGIPNIGMVSGGKVSHTKLEHVWVEAWIDYQPSRGAVHRVGDSWVPMDASFKQYEYSEGMALEEQVPFDAEGLAQTIQEQSTINEEEGWVQGVPQQAMEDSLTDYRAQLEGFLENQAPDASVGDVLGTHSIKEVIHEQLAISLPYELLTRKLVASELPDSLRWKFQYQLHTSLYGTPDTQLLRIEQPTVALAGKKLSLSFKPATPDDEETLASYLPEPDENGEIDPNDIPDTLPGYLIALTGEFAIDDGIAATAVSNMAMGEELLSEMGYWQPGRGWRTTRNQPVAGEYRALALNLQGISQQQAQALQTDLESTQQKLESEDFAGLTKQQVVGDLLYSTILSYFALNDVQDQIAQKQASSIGYRAPSYGLFKTSLTPQYWFGVPRDVKAEGLTMDVDHMTGSRVDKENDHQRWVSFNRAQGARMSAMEHLVPEKMFSTEEAPAHGISAVKAVQIAAAEGQKIWTITQDNLSIALPNLQLSSEIKSDIRNSVNAGKEVTAHERPVNFFGRQSTGYTVIDSHTGAGAYLIAGGENGGNTGFSGDEKFLVAGISFDVIKQVFGALWAGVNAVFNFDNCGPGVAITILVIAMILIAFKLWLIFIVAASALIKGAAAVMAFLFSGLVSWGLTQTCKRED